MSNHLGLSACNDELLTGQCGATGSGTYGEEEEELGELSFVEEVGQVLHGIVPQHRDVLVLARVLSSQTTCNDAATQHASGDARGHQQWCLLGG
jgi:hypothetical protein